MTDKITNKQTDTALEMQGGNTHPISGGPKSYAHANAPIPRPISDAILRRSAKHILYLDWNVDANGSPPSGHPSTLFLNVNFVSIYIVCDQ